jgi:hypothetical protein
MTRSVAHARQTLVLAGNLRRARPSMGVFRTPYTPVTRIKKTPDRVVKVCEKPLKKYS